MSALDLYARQCRRLDRAADPPACMSRRRHVLADGESLSQHAALAAQRALDMAGIAAADVDLIILCTSSPDDLFGSACQVRCAALSRRMQCHVLCCLAHFRYMSHKLCGVVCAGAPLGCACSHHRSSPECRR